jgi:hypothetical protein
MLEEQLARISRDLGVSFLRAGQRQEEIDAAHYPDWRGKTNIAERADAVSECENSSALTIAVLSGFAKAMNNGVGWLPKSKVYSASIRDSSSILANSGSLTACQISPLSRVHGCYRSKKPILC